jgi:hypothetical protein
MFIFNERTEKKNYVKHFHGILLNIQSENNNTIGEKINYLKCNCNDIFIGRVN